MGQVLNWVTLMGLALIMGGSAILLFALAVAMMLAPRRRRRRGRAGPRPVPTPRPSRGPAPVRVSQPVISRSVLLADTLALQQLASRPERDAADPVLSIITQPTGRESTGGGSTDSGSPPRGSGADEAG